MLTSFAKDLTEKLNTNNGRLFWLCIGQEEKGSTGSSGSSGSSGDLCDYQTQVLSNGLDLDIAERKVKPDVKVKKFVYLFNAETRIVELPDTDRKAAYRTAAGGFFNIFSETQFTCGETSKFEASNFAACLGETCKEEDQAGIEAAMATIFAKKMSDSKELERSFSCTVSGAGSLSYHGGCRDYRSLLGRSLATDVRALPFKG